MNPTLQRQNAENLKQLFPEKEYRGLSPISTFMCLWANYIFPRWVCLFYWKKYVDWSCEYINRSKTHECGNWGWGRAIPRKGIYKRNCRCSAPIEVTRNPTDRNSKEPNLLKWLGTSPIEEARNPPPIEVAWNPILNISILGNPTSFLSMAGNSSLKIIQEVTPW
jgi:hypothetical protein